jgi:hypothetical protein|tara:strand:+ start:487 stop:744 length:258 start_codon:yes stop_codon:yes gene_type:complete
MKKKTKRKWSKGVGPRAIYGSREDKLLDEEYIVDSCPIPEALDRQNLDDMYLDEDDYELQQEKMYGVESENSEPIPLDRYFKRIR